MREIALLVRDLNMVQYEETFAAMKQHVFDRIQHKNNTKACEAENESKDESHDESNYEPEDELWILEHPPVFTQGQAGKPEHLLSKTSIPVIQSDRGGQITYHGPGQVVVYILMDIVRKGFSIRDLVCRLEQSIIHFLAKHQIEASRKAGAPGVYVGDAKIASIGLRIKKGISYHGLSFNVDMDLKPFEQINPCGFSGLKLVQFRNLLQSETTAVTTDLISYTKKKLVQELATGLEYSNIGKYKGT